MTGDAGEFDLLAENAAELGLSYSPDARPKLSRLTTRVAPAQDVSAIRWGAALLTLGSPALHADPDVGWSELEKTKVPMTLVRWRQFRVRPR